MTTIAIVISVALSAASAFAQRRYNPTSEQECEKYRLRDDYDACVAEFQAGEERRQQQAETSNGVRERVREYRSIVVGIVEAQGGPNRKAFQEMLQNRRLEFARNLDNPACRDLLEQDSFPEIQRAKLISVGGAVTLDDFRNAVLGGVLMPQATGQIYPDGETHKAPNGWFQDQVLDSTRSPNERQNAWIEKSNQINGAYNRADATLKHFSKATATVGNVLPRTREERESYERHLKLLKRSLGAANWPVIDQTWAQRFAQEQGDCRNFKRTYVDPYQKNAEGLDPEVQQYLWLLLKYAYYATCTPKEPEVVAAHKSALDSFVNTANQSIKSNSKFVGRQLRIAASAEQSDDGVVDVMRQLKECLRGQVEWVKGMRPQ